MSGVVTRRLNRTPLYLAGIAILIVVGLIIYTVNLRYSMETAVPSSTDTSTPAAAGNDANALFKIPEKEPDKPKLVDDHYTPPQQTPPPEDAATKARREAWAAYYAEHAKYLAEKDKQFGAALVADTDAASPSAGHASSTPSSGGSIALPSTGGIQVPSAAGHAEGGGGGQGGTTDSQAEKRSFMLGQTGDPLGLNEQLAGMVHGPKRDTIMQGTALPGLMVGGVNSDMPGQIKGMIDQNIYDDATGDDLLIPAGTFVIGNYDNSVSYGQTRVGVVWTRLVFPDSSSRQIGAMEGADQGGYAGEHDLVNTHFWDKFWAATLISIAGAGAQLSQPQDPVRGYYSPEQTATQSIAQGYQQLAQEYARAGLSIPNTLEIRPGYRFTVMVMKDMTLPPYHDQRDENGHLIVQTKILQ